MLSQATTAGEACPLLAPIDAEIRDEIGRLGFHPFILVRQQLSSPRFVVCKTETYRAEFADALSRLPDLGTGTLLRAIERTLRSQIHEAVDALLSWVQGAEANCVEKVYLGVPDGLDCPAYYGYPVFERTPTGQHGSAEDRLQMLSRVVDAYEGSDGNHATRFALMESLALGLSRALGARDRFAEALRVVERGLAHLPQSTLLNTAKYALDVQVRGKTAMGKSEIAPEEEELLAFVSEHFDPAYYLKSYSDVAHSGLDPLEHFLNIGVKAEHQISSSIQVRYGKVAGRSTDRNWRHYRWRGIDIAARPIRPMPPEIMAQIIDQARYDPAVLAAVTNTIAKSGDRESLGDVDVAGLQRAIPYCPEFFLIVPNLDTGGEQRLGAELVAALSDAGFRSILTLVADQESQANFDGTAIPAAFGKTNLVFWQDFLIHSPALLRLAQLIRVLRPRVTIVGNSRIGHEMVLRFGGVLSECTKLYCLYTEAEGRDFGACFPRQTLPFATGLTDDAVLGANLGEQYGDILGHGVVVLPPRLNAIPEEVFQNRLAARRQRSVSRASSGWAWGGSLMHSKATQILARLAKRRPNDHFELFGALDGSLHAVGLALPNVVCREPIKDFAAADFSSCDGFLFTSASQGAPVLALEMSQHAIPLVLAKEAGLRGTFDEQAAFFVEPGTEDEIATGFSFALDQIKSLPDSRTATIVVTARNQTLKRHSPAAFVAAVAALFGPT